MSTIAITWKQPKVGTIIGILALVLVLVALVSVSIGQVTIPLKDMVWLVWHKVGLTNQQPDAVYETVLWSIRLPRIVMTILIGAALAVSGAALQGLFRNPLVEPGLIGVSSGAALAVVTWVVFGSFLFTDSALGVSLLMPVVAFAGGFAATVLVMKIGQQLGKINIAVLILGGVAINALAGALMGLVIFYADENQLRMFTFWTLGDLGGATWQKVFITAPLLIVSSVWMLTYTSSLNAIAVGEAEAFHMGVDVERIKKSIVFFSALAVGVSVSLAGIIGFIGLVVPHLVRVIFHADNRLVLPASLLGGPILLLLADLVARTLVAPTELPIGVVTALIGAPFFIFLLVRTNHKNEFNTK
ncbi:MAG: iron ABC transporter permease [Cyclobacteriaceae bacterium]|nr:MAG: iron ABC transporter permease [Cyclobacteriaceae bacterium]